MITHPKSAPSQSGQSRPWEEQRMDSYDVEVLRQDYRERLYSEEGRKLLESEVPPTNGRPKQK